MKPFAVAVMIGDKKQGKEFDTEDEMKQFLEKAEALKKQAPQLQVHVIRNGEVPKKPLTDLVLPPTVKLNMNREESLCWRRILRNGKPVTDNQNQQLYQCVPVPKKAKVFYCPYCNAYKNWSKVDYGYGLIVNGCADCETSDEDFYVKTANDLWGKG